MPAVKIDNLSSRIPREELKSMLADILEAHTDAYGISLAARGELDAVIVGADAIYKGMLVNKVGTYALSAAAEKSGVEFTAVLTTDKVFPEDIELSEEEIMQFHDPKEITEKAKVINLYFEMVEIRG